MVHTARSGHHVEECLDGGITELELLSVICIETSHYVCFSRSEDQWIFFDSMANRVCECMNCLLYHEFHLRGIHLEQFWANQFYMESLWLQMKDFILILGSPTYLEVFPGP